MALSPGQHTGPAGGERVKKKGKERSHSLGEHKGLPDCSGMSWFQDREGASKTKDPCGETGFLLHTNLL